MIISRPVKSKKVQASGVVSTTVGEDADYVAPSPASCGFTLTGANAGTYGMTAPSISGQRFFVKPTAAANYFCNSVESVSSWGSGIRWHEVVSYSETDPQTATRAGIIDAATGQGLMLTTTTSGGVTSRSIDLYNPITGSGTASTVISNGTGAVALGIDGATGDCYYNIGAGDVKLSGSFLGAFSGTSSFVLAGRINGDGSSDAEATFVTAAPSFASATSGSDLCGNAV